MSSDGLRAPADANLLVPRSSLQKILASIHRGNCSLVIGPRYRGKSKLVRRAAEDLAQTRFYQVAYASMHEVSQAASQQFYRTLFDTICSQTGDRTSMYSDVESASDFQNAMLELIGRCENNLLLLIDDLEIAPPNLIALLLSAIRSVFTTVANQSGTRFQAIISGSVNLHQLALRGISHFASISDLILVDDMTLEEARIYAAGLFSQESIQVPDKALDAFLVQTSSDPVLIRFLAHACIAQIWSLNEPGLYADMLPDAVERVLRHKPNYEIAEALSQIEGDPELLSCLLEILQKGEMHLSELPLRMADHPNALDLSGVFHHKEGAYSIKAPLWRSLLEKHFSSAHCGRLYAIAGLWSRAIEQYEKAIHRDKIDKKSDLFGATINGMQASEDDREALAVLAQGLHACYPNCEIGIYLRTESVLGLEHFFPGKKTGSESLRQEIQLDEHTSPEVEALQGPDYSKISSRQKVRFLIPLRVHSGAPAIGLVSYCGGLSMLDQHEQREEVLQFVSFLHQAARAIESRRKYSTVLRDARSHSQTLEGLDHILTSVLNHLDLPEEVIFRLLLAGLTANEGLGFNRAALFLLNDQGWLVGTMGVGHLSWEEADADWKSLPFTSIDELMEALMVLNYQYTSLHAVVQSVRFPIQNEDLFGKVHQDGMARRGFQLANLPPSLVTAIDPAKEFAIAPLTAGTRRLGLVYVDNKYTRKPIDQFQMASLTSFLTQATLVMQMARSLQAERHQSQILSRLLEIEKTINNKITQSMQEVLEEIARSARGLMAASSTVAFNLKHVASVEQEGYFEADRMARVHTRVAPLGVPNSKEGMLKWVLADGQINVTDIQFASSFPDGYHPEQSKFLKKEGVRSFVGLRLGTREQPVGVLFINWYSPHQLSKNELTILEVFAAFATAAISSAGKHEQMRQELQQRTQELQTLSNLIESSLDSRPEGELENLILETLTSLREQTRARIVRLFVLESGDHLREYRLARRGFLASRVLTRLENGPVITALDSGIVVTERFVQTPPGRQAQNGNTASSRVRSAIPLLKGKNRLGAFYLETLEEDFSLVDDEKRDFIRYLADRLAITFHQTEIYNALRRLLDISIMLKPEFELKQVIRELVEGAVQAMPSISAVTAYFMNQQSRQFEIGHMVGVHSRDFARRYTLIPGSIVDRLIKRDGPIFADFTEQDVDLYSPFAIREGIKSTAAMPLEIGKEMVGYIFFNFRRQYYFDETRKTVRYTSVISGLARAISGVICATASNLLCRRAKSICRFVR